jgi:hypothetical protein
VYHQWATGEDEKYLNILIDVLKEGNGKTQDGKIKSETWNTSIKKYNEMYGATLERKHVDSRHKTWCTLYHNYKKIAQQSGWGGNFIQGIFDVNLKVWEEFMKVMIFKC